MFVECDPSNERFRIALVDFNVPYSWYTLNDEFNTIEFHDVVADTTTEVTVPPGSYNYFDLAPVISKLYPAVKTQYLAPQNKMKFTFETLHRVKFSHGIADILGYYADIEYLFNLSGSSIKPCSPLATTHLILKVNNLPPLDSNVNLTNLTGEVTPSYILATVPITNIAPFHEITWINHLDVGVFTSDPKITTIDFQIINQDGVELTFIPDHRFTLRIDVYDVEEHDELHRNVVDIRDNVRNIFLNSYLVSQ